MGLDLGKFLRDRKDQAVRQWQDSVVLDAVSSGTKADNARRQVVADKERALDVGRSQAVKFQGQQFREGKIDRDKLLSNINSIVGFDTLEDQGLRKQGDLYFNTQKDNNVNTFLNNAGSAIMNAAPQRVIGGAAEYGGTLIGNEDIRDFGQKISQPYRDFGAAAQENAGNKVVATGSQVVGNLLTLPLNPAGKVGMATRFATAALPRAADTSFAIRQGGGSENAQKIGGGAVGAVSGVMNTLGGEKVLKPFTGVASKAANPLTKLLTTKLAPRVAGRVLAAGNMEGLEEVTETGVENLVAQKTFDPNRKLTDNLAQSYVLGAGMGSAVRGGVELGSMRSSTTPTQLTPEVQNKRNNLANAYTTLVDQGRPDQAAYFAREIDQIDNPAPGTLRERIRSAKERIITPLDGVGSVPIGSPLIPIPKKLQNKLGGADPLESLKAEARKYKSAEEFANAKINSYHQTDADFTKFENSFKPFTFSNAHFFSNAKPDKLVLKNLVEAYTDLKNPLMLDDGNITQPMVDKAIKDGYDGIINPNSNGTEVAVFNPDEILTRKQLTDLYNQATQSQPPKSPIESLKQEATPKYMQDKVTPEGYFTEGRYKDSAYPKNFVAKADIPHTGIKAGDRVALIKGRDGRFDAILSKKYKEKSTGYTISRESFVDPKSFTSSTKGTSPELVPTPVKQTAKGNNTPIKGTQSQPPKSPIESLKQEAKPATGARSDYSPENLQANRQIRAKNASSITYADKKTINPDELVTVYRAVPGKAKGGLVEGDWVTPNKEQARLFMKQSWAQDDTGAKIVTKKVKASELRYHADDAKGYVDDELLYVPKATQSQPPKSPPVQKVETPVESKTNQGLRDKVASEIERQVNEDGVTTTGVTALNVVLADLKDPSKFQDHIKLAIDNGRVNKKWGDRILAAIEKHNIATTETSKAGKKVQINKTIYHGTNQEVTEKVFTNEGGNRQDFGAGSYFFDKKSDTKQYGKNTVEATISPDANIVEMTGKEHNKMTEHLYQTARDKGIDSNKMRGSQFAKAMQELQRDFFLEQGIDGVRITGGRNSEVTVIYDPKVISKKSTPPKKPFTPISQPVDNLPAVVKQVTKKQTSEQKIAPPVVAPTVQKQTPAPRPIKTTKPKSPERLVVGGKSAEVSSDGRIANIDEFVKQQVAEQEAEPEKTGRISKLKRVWIDTLSPAEDNFRQAVKDGKLSQETLDDIIVKNGKSIRSGTAANINLVESGLVDLLHNKSKEDYDNLGQTLIAIHAKDLRANGIETGRDAALDEQIVAKYGEQFKADIEQFRDAANYVLDKSVASQLISKETADMLKKKYPNYVPMNRVMEELENTGSFNSSQIASIGKQTVVRKIKGSKRTVENPLESMISKVQDMTKQSLKNEAAIAWVDALKKTGDAKLIEGTVKPGESTISVIRNGNKEIYSVEPEMEAAAKGLTKEQMGTITNAARKVSRVFKTGTTGLNLPFIVTNLARDQQNALLNQSKGELETFKAIPTAIMETLGHGKLYQEAVRNGAISTSFDLTKPNLKLTAANIRKRGSSLGALSKIEDVIGRSEEYTRIQQYKATKEYWLEQGMSESQAQNKATIAAQQNSADFARAGDLGQILNAWLPYTNAGVQGTRSTLRAAKNNPVRYATKAGAMLVMPTIMTALWNTGDEERKKIYDDISENDKQASFIVITPWAKKNEEGKWEGIVKIPKPPGISALLYPVEKGVASMNGLDPVGFKDIVKGVLGFGSPLGDNLNAAVSTVTPQAIKPAVEATINRNLFTNRDIVPYWLKDKPANEQAYKGSSGTARMISSLTGVSPIKVEHMIRGYGGELGLQGLNAADNALNKAGLIPKEQIGGISIPAGFKKRFTEAYDKPGSTIQRGTGAGASATAAKNYEDAVAGIKSSYGGKYAELTEEEVKELGKTDADAKDYYKTLQAVKQSSKTPDELPTNLNPLATSIYEKEARLTTDGKDKWNKRPSVNKEVNNTIKSWLPKGVDAPRITNETTKKWADYEKKKADGTLGKLEEEAVKRTILRSAYNSVLTEDEKDLYTLSKDKLLDAYDRGVINDQNIDKALKVERQLFDAGLISTETLAKKLGLVARGYKGRSGGRGGRGGSSKIAKDTSVAFSNALQSTTLKRLNSLLAGTQSGGSTSRRVATSKPVLKKISVKA